MRYVVGIDLGHQGAIAVLSIDGAIAHLTDMPIEKMKVNGKERSFLDLAAFAAILNTFDEEVLVVVEKLHTVAGPISSSASNFSLGYSLGTCEALLHDRLCQTQWVTAQSWQKHYDLRGKKRGEIKFLVNTLAQQLFPKAELVTPRGRILDGRSDALLIAEFGRRKVLDEPEFGKI